MNWLLPPHLFLLCAAAMAGLHLFWPVARIIPEPVWPAGLAVAVAGLVLTVVPARLFRRRSVNIRTFDAPTGLVTDGFFAISRNPMYLGFLLVLAGLWIGLGTLSPLLPVLVFLMAAEHWYIPFEEKRMAEQFGEDYRVYRGRVRRWLGRK